MSNSNLTPGFLVVARQAPYGSSQAREGLDAALTAAAFGQPVSLLFMDDGVYQLLPDQSPAALEQKNLASMLAVLPMYEIEQLYVDSHSLEQRGLLDTPLCIPVQRLDSDQVAALVQRHTRILTF